VFAAMAAMFVLALTIPEAFTDLPGGLDGPVVVALCYFAFRLLHLVMFWIIARRDGDTGLAGQLARFSLAMLAGTGILLVASQLHGAAQTAVWAAALVADYGGTFIAGAGGWRLRSAHHFSERHGLILLVALGESIVAIGVGIAALPVSWPIVAAAVLGLALAAALWWTYFDMTSLKGERALAGLPEAERPRLARDAYSFLHLPLVGGVVLLALGLKKAMEYVGDVEHHHLTDPLTGVALYALYGGAALYLFGLAWFTWRTVRILDRVRVGTAVLVVALLPLAAQVPALAQLALLTAVAVGLVVLETIRLAEERDRVRHAEAAHGHGPGHEGSHPSGLNPGQADRSAAGPSAGRS
jgi:low temperature requirement protein LtrA